MLNSFRTFMADIIDYAGMFPPAKLKMDEAVGIYIRHRNEKKNWMLARFICPSNRLTELKNCFLKFEDKTPFRISVLSYHKSSNTNFLDNLRDVVNSVKAFLDNTGSKFTIDIIETRLPPEIFQKNNSTSVKQILECSNTLFESADLSDISLFFEINYPAGWKEVLSMVVEEFSVFSRKSLNIKRAGIKLRCGGPHPSAFIDPSTVARVIKECRDAMIPLKATAGLHHPIRHFNQRANAMEHGFLNLFGAGILALVHGLKEEHLIPILEDQTPENFVFHNASFAWKKYHASAEDIAAARRTLMTSFGSCSLTEPEEDLIKLGLF